MRKYKAILVEWDSFLHNINNGLRHFYQLQEEPQTPKGAWRQTNEPADFFVKVQVCDATKG